MSKPSSIFSEEHTLHQLHHLLPSQNPLKDFIHHNSLHAYDGKEFHSALAEAATTFGYRTYLPLTEYRSLYKQGFIAPEVLDAVLRRYNSEADIPFTEQEVLHAYFDETYNAEIGRFRAGWKEYYHLNMDKAVHPLLFRLVANYTDQGIGVWQFPRMPGGFLSSLRKVEQTSAVSFFRDARVRTLFLTPKLQIIDVLRLLLGDNESCYEQYILDQQFAHPGWSGMVAVLERNPNTLYEKRRITLREFILVELLLELDYVYTKLKGNFRPFGEKVPYPVAVEQGTAKTSSTLFSVYALWQEAYEWSYYDYILRGFAENVAAEYNHNTQEEDYQALFCIDDRECSIRRHIEHIESRCKTFGTAGFFNVEFYFQPEHSRHFTKSCPAPLQPQYLIKETEARKRHTRSGHFSHKNKGFFSGWLLSNVMGFSAAFELAKSILFPKETPATVSSFKHMDIHGKLSVECHDSEHHVHGLQVGFTVPEMADRMEGLLKSIGLTSNFAKLLYIVGHGASSVNNTHYAGYDCGACSGRAGSVNARVAATMLNNPKVREELATRGIDIPSTTHAVAALHDTTRDEVQFFDEEHIPPTLRAWHERFVTLFATALDNNAKERANRFDTVKQSTSVQEIHQQVKQRAFSLFEPRPEWNHATNSLCIIGRRERTKHLFLDRRAFLNSYDYAQDESGEYLAGILKAVTPVCTGINLEYYFSKVDNQRLGAGSKLSHNVVGLIGVANGIDGDLRYGLPLQMVNIHNPLRLLTVIEHYPEIAFEALQRYESVWNCYNRGWAHVAVIHPTNKSIYFLQEGKLQEYCFRGEAAEALQTKTLVELDHHNNIQI